MDVSDYTLGLLARDRLARAREDAARRALVPLVRRESLRVRLGAWLVAVGRYLLREVPQRAAT
jgi:hypothetical protein